MPLCKRHDAELVTAIELRGLYRKAVDVTANDPLTGARDAIDAHATHFAGRAAVAMLRNGRCPLCFVNEAIRRDGKNPGLTVDDWVNNAADEQLEADIARRDGQQQHGVIALA